MVEDDPHAARRMIPLFSQRRNRLIMSLDGFATVTRDTWASFNIHHVAFHYTIQGASCNDRKAFAHGVERDTRLKHRPQLPPTCPKIAAACRQTSRTRKSTRGEFSWDWNLQVRRSCSDHITSAQSVRGYSKD